MGGSSVGSTKRRIRVFHWELTNRISIKTYIVFHILNKKFISHSRLDVYSKKSGKLKSRTNQIGYVPYRVNNSFINNLLIHLVMDFILRPYNGMERFIEMPGFSSPSHKSKN